ncbi:60S ribosomal protein L18 [Intoshia linei]|uniref:60S ribosomal protein L18 n=1 Tax=Intoshia linei TaxID=1819745 RepID=A0A177BDM7_9BILA|nr:60S ribosomal protein L18 [Intoshia linei]
MGIDVSHRNKRKVRRTHPASEDIYLGLLVKVYRFLARRTDKKFNKIILKRLCMSRNNRPPVSIKKLVKNMKTDDNKEKIAVVVGTVTDDSRIFQVPKIRICAIKFTDNAQKRILAAGGEILTFDQLAKISPLGTNTVLMRGSLKARTSYRYFGRGAGLPQSHTR